MSQLIRARVSNELYETLVKLSKATGKSLSKTVSELLQQAVKQDMSQATLFSKLLAKLESMELHQKSMDHQPVDFEKFKQLIMLILNLITEHGKLIFVMPDKAQKFSEIAKEIEEKIREL